MPAGMFSLFCLLYALVWFATRLLLRSLYLVISDLRVPRTPHPKITLIPSLSYPHLAAYLVLVTNSSLLITLLF